mmetsp:Transcript_31623/g.80211  ORF Transcript_31623/g.80211 Transcript_31623/m.80211 type:complete len:275 (-) Transcript_31623:349-1173(-)
MLPIIRSSRFANWTAMRWEGFVSLGPTTVPTACFFTTIWPFTVMFLAAYTVCPSKYPPMTGLDFSPADVLALTLRPVPSVAKSFRFSSPPSALLASSSADFFLASSSSAAFLASASAFLFASASNTFLLASCCRLASTSASLRLTSSAHSAACSFALFLTSRSRALASISLLACSGSMGAASCTSSGSANLSNMMTFHSLLFLDFLPFCFESELEEDDSSEDDSSEDPDDSSFFFFLPLAFLVRPNLARSSFLCSLFSSLASCIFLKFSSNVFL